MKPEPSELFKRWMEGTRERQGRRLAPASERTVVIKDIDDGADADPTDPALT